MTQTIIAETERLQIRQFRRDDLDALSAVLSDPEVMRFSLGGVKTKPEVAGFIEKALEIYPHVGFGIWAVIDKANSEIIGYCGLIPQKIDGQRWMELGYRLGTAYWGKGYATEAAEVIKEYAFQRLGLKRLISIIEAENVGSWKVAEKIGMRYEKDSTFGDKVVRIYAIER